MDGDFPAAHSMDTKWFAVDAKGHVGVFVSEENGGVPYEFIEHQHNTFLSEMLDDLRGRPWPSERTGTEFVAEMEEAKRFGFFFYFYAGDSGLGVYMPYEIDRRPAAPLHVDQLPPRWRMLVKTVQFPTNDFTTDDTIQPADHVGCAFWTEVVWYLAADNRTVRRLTGSLREFAKYARQLRREEPELSKNLIFEGVDDKPPAKPRRKKKGS
jgi:hypothetical protein